jgi:hypothetical protein
LNLGISNVLDNVSADRSVRFLPALIAALLLFALLAPIAAADPYTVYSCKGPLNEPLSASAWTSQSSVSSSDADVDFVGACSGSENDGVAVEATPGEGALGSGDFGQLLFEAPAFTTITGYGLAANVVANVNSGESALSAVVRETNGGSFHDRGCILATDSCSQSLAGDDTTLLSKLALRVQCVVGPCQANGIDLRAGFSSASVTLNDVSDPQITASASSLFGPPAIGTLNTVSFFATDRGSGVSTMAYALDNGEPQVVHFGGACVQPYTQPRPCELSQNQTFGIDSATLSPGTHQLTFSATDAAGNGSVPISRSFTVLPGGIPTVTAPVVSAFNNGTPAVERPVISLPPKTMIFNKRGIVTVPGTLTTAAGAPIKGATLAISALDVADADAATVALPSVMTASDGSFTVPFPAAGAKRLTVSFKPNSGSDATVSASVLVRQKLSLTAKRSRGHVEPGKAVVISGVLAGAGGGAKGAPVEIDVRVHKSWRAVGVVRASASGKYRWKYRFVRVRSATKFTFRAVARSSKAWPWPTEIGSTVKVLVAP